MVACTLVLICAHPALIHAPLVFALPFFLLLYVHPTTLAADAAADGAAVAAPWLLLPLLPLPPRVRTPHKMAEGGDGGRWCGDAGMVMVVVGPCIRKCEREGLGAEISKPSSYSSVSGVPSGTTRAGGLALVSVPWRSIALICACWRLVPACSTSQLSFMFPRPSFVLPGPRSYSPKPCLYSPAIVSALPSFLLPYACPTTPAADAATATVMALGLRLPLPSLLLRLPLLPLLLCLLPPPRFSLPLLPWFRDHPVLASLLCGTLSVKAQLVL
jgi:hypothetical protein